MTSLIAGVLVKRASTSGGRLCLGIVSGSCVGSIRLYAAHNEDVTGEVVAKRFDLRAGHLIMAR